MNQLLTTMFALAVACVTAASHADEIKGNAAAGETKIAMCQGCHAIIGYQATFPEVYKVPKLSGQTAGYISSALTAYRAGERMHPTMRGIADSLTDQDIADVAAFYSANAGQMPAPADAAPTGKVADLVTKGACFSCHGGNFAKPLQPSYPVLAGQNADYLFVALKSYKAGVTSNPVFGRSNAVMGGVAKQFSNDELKELANYVSSLDGPLKTVPESRFR